MAATVPAISVQGLTKRFGDLVAVDDVTFDVAFGAVTGFVGANGSGKTTTMRSIVGLTRPTSGDVLIAGIAHGSEPTPRKTIGCVLDRLGAHPGLTGRQHLGLVSAGTDRQRYIDRVLAEVGLSDAADRRTGKYSTGMRQRLALAAALIFEPSVLLLDEPARGLDPAGIRWLRSLLREKADAGTAIFVSTHQLAELSTIVEHVVVIDEGRIVTSEPADELLRRTGETRLEEAVFAVAGGTNVDDVRHTAATS